MDIIQKTIGGVKFQITKRNGGVQISRRGREGGHRDITVPMEVLHMAVRESEFGLTLTKCKSLLSLVQKAQHKFRMEAEAVDPSKAVRFLACLWSLAVEIESEIALIPSKDVNYLRTLRSECECVMQQFYIQCVRLAAILSHRGLSELLPMISFEEGRLEFDLDLLRKEDHE